MMRFWKRAGEGGRKSFRLEELPSEGFLPQKPGILVPYLEGLALDLKTRD